MKPLRLVLLVACSVFVASLTACSVRAQAQDPLQPPSDTQIAHRTDLTPQQKYERISGAMNRLVSGGRATNIDWSEDGTSVAFNSGRDRFRFDLTNRTLAPLDETGETADAPATRSRARGSRMPARGRQRDREESPDGKWVAVCRDWNVVIEPVQNGDSDSPADEPLVVTTAGHRKHRFGTASWVYGEELDQRDAMWWSPDSSMLAFYEFDEQLVPDHYIAAGLTDLHTHVLTEGYPKPGEPNPIANLRIFHLDSRETIAIEPAAEGQWYTYAVEWSPDGRELLFHRTNRRQDTLHLMAADPRTGQTRIILTETQETWQSNRPTMEFLDDGKRFIWETEKTGWKNYQLRDLDGQLIATLTDHPFPVAGIERIDEQSGTLYYTAYSDRERPLNAHVHRVDLDGSNEKKLTSGELNHTSIDLSPDGRWFTAVQEAIDVMPRTVLFSTEGELIVTLAESDRSNFDNWSLPMPEMFTFKADDGTTDLFGVLFKPSDFDPKRTYPLVIDVYGGPESQSVRNRFVAASPACEYGFVIARIDNRGTVNRGKAFESATYMRLGEKDIKDQADAVKYLSQRPYIDGSRVGIYGQSYGGYMAALGVLKHPDVFHVAVAGAPVTDWKNYDTIYTERYMRTPEENPDGYRVGSCLEHAERLRGKLLLIHGMVDDNVHANNSWQLIDLLHDADKPFDMMFYPNADHGVGGRSSSLRWRYLREHLLQGD